jgi:hypothetical protein
MGAEILEVVMEILNLCDLELLNGQPESRIEYKRGLDSRFLGADKESIDSFEAVRQIPPMLRAEKPEDSQWLRLSDQS